MGPKDGGIFHRGVPMGLEVAYKAFLGNDYSLIDSINPFNDINVDVADWVRNGGEGVLDNHLVENVPELDQHILEVGHPVIEVVVDDVCSDVGGPFTGVGDDVVKADLEV